MEHVILKRRDVRRDDQGSGHQGDGRSEPMLRTLSEDGVVRAIEVTCACGQAVTVELAYPLAQAAGDPAAHEGGSGR